MRIETGALQIDDDYTGLFIRGDDAFTLRYILTQAQDSGLATSHAEILCSQLLDAIELDVNHGSVNRNVQRIKTK